MPGLLQYQTDIGVGGPTMWDMDPNPEDVDLFLPSHLPAHRQVVACIEGLPGIEVKLWTAQCVDALVGRGTACFSDHCLYLFIIFGTDAKTGYAGFHPKLAFLYRNKYHYINLQYFHRFWPK